MGLTTQDFADEELNRAQQFIEHQRAMNNSAVQHASLQNELEYIMALRVDINKQYAVRALENAIASLKRSEGKGLNPDMLKLIQQDIAAYQNAINTIQEIK